MNDALDSDFEERLGGLSAARRELLRRRLLAVRADVSSRGSAKSVQRLTAFVTLHEDGAQGQEAIRRQLERRLPGYMVPQDIEVLAEMPRTAAGKVDRAALVSSRSSTPEPVLTSAIDETADTGTAAATLARIWAEVLGLSEVGLDEDFFELGGDSLLSIRILARANQEGLNISPEAFFALPTIAQQAAVAGAGVTAKGSNKPVTGKVPYLPIQHWFFERIRTDTHHWNQSFLFRLRDRASLSDLERAVQALLTHHDGLRLQPGNGDAGTQRLTETSVNVPVSRLDLSSFAEAERDHAIEAHARVVNASFDLRQAPLFRVVLFDTDQAGEQRLLMTAHHLLVDGISWRLLLEDMERALASAARGEAMRFPAKTNSIKTWANRLVEYARTDAATRELPMWLATGEVDFELPGVMDGGAEPQPFGSARMLRSTLSTADTEALLRELPVTFRTRINEVLLCALGKSLADWAGVSSVRLDLEGHGREALFDDLDVSRTIGWFTSVFPVLLDYSDAGDSLVDALLAVRDQLRAIPNGGVGYGVLRELDAGSDASRQLRAQSPSSVLFNYLGATRSHGEESRRLELLDGAFGGPRSEHGNLAYLLEINAYLERGALSVDWCYASQVHSEAQIERLAAAFTSILGTLIAAARQSEQAAFAPDDFPLAEFDQEDLDDLAAVLKDIDGVS